MNAVRQIRLVALALVLSAAASLWTAAPAKASDYDTYAAIAYSPSTGAYGYGYGFSSRAAAELEALDQCSGRDARVVVWTRNSYCALAVGDDGAYGSAWGTSPSIARNIALQKCRDNDGVRPHIVVTVYSGD
jgi:Domain of unknown function (DUF4189)